jgi:hypothetical protein
VGSNMETRGVGGVYLKFMCCLGWGYKKILRGPGMIFLITLDLRWVMIPKLDFGMMCGAAIKPSR